MKSQTDGDKFKDKIIGIDNLNKGVSFDEKYLSDSGIIHLLYEMSTGEVHLTRDGLEFVKEYWGFSKIAEMLFDFEGGKGDFTDGFGSKDKIVEWLNSYKVIPMQ